MYIILAVGEDYLPVSDASVLGSVPPDGTVATSVTTLNDSVVEYRENVFVSARVVETGLPVVVNGSADISIVSDDGMCQLYFTFLASHHTFL